MIALGLTALDAAGALPAPCVCDKGPEAALVMATVAAVPNKAALLALRVKAHRALPVFLPFAGRPRATEAWVWAQAHPVADALATLRGQGQLTVLFQRPAGSDTSASGAGWLRARAAEAQGQARLVAYLERLAAGEPFIVKPSPDRVALHLLVPTREMAAQERAWAARLSQPTRETVGWRATLTGGWPPAAFWTPPEQEHCAA